MRKNERESLFVWRSVTRKEGGRVMLRSQIEGGEEEKRKEPQTNAVMRLVTHTLNRVSD